MGDPSSIVGKTRRRCRHVSAIFQARCFASGQAGTVFFTFCSENLIFSLVICVCIPVFVYVLVFVFVFVFVQKKDEQTGRILLVVSSQVAHTDQSLPWASTVQRTMGPLAAHHHWHPPTHAHRELPPLLLQAHL